MFSVFLKEFFSNAGKTTSKRESSITLRSLSRIILFFLIFSFSSFSFYLFFPFNANIKLINRKRGTRKFSHVSLNMNVNITSHVMIFVIVHVHDPYSSIVAKSVENRCLGAAVCSAGTRTQSRTLNNE